MNAPDAPARRFLVEWYRADLAAATPAGMAHRLAASAAAARARGGVTWVVLTLTSPGDDTVFGVLSADTVEAVQRVCRDAGCLPDRITADVLIFIPPVTRPPAASAG
jgi:hypothetical protein